MAIYNNKLEAETRKKEEEIVKKVEKGAVSFEAGSTKIEKLEEKKAEVPTRVVKELVIVDEGAIPKEYWVVDMVKLRRDAFSGKKIDGVNVEDKKIIVNQ